MSQHELPRAERMARTADLLDAAAGAAVGERRAALDEVVLLNRCVADSIVLLFVVAAPAVATSSRCLQ